MSERSRWESLSWAFNIILVVGGAFVTYHLYMMGVHDPVGSSAAVAKASKAQAAAIILRMESDNQNLRNHYLKNIDEGKNVEESQAQISRLEYNRGALTELKHGVLGDQ